MGDRLCKIGSAPKVLRSVASARSVRVESAVMHSNTPRSSRVATRSPRPSRENEEASILLVTAREDLRERFAMGLKALLRGGAEDRMRSLDDHAAVAAVLRKERFDLVILDGDGASRSGPTTLAEIRAVRSDQRVAIVVDSLDRMLDESLRSVGFDACHSFEEALHFDFARLAVEFAVGPRPAAPQSERNWQHTIDAMEQAVVLISDDGRIRHANRAFAELVGIHEESAPGRSIGEFLPEWNRKATGQLEPGSSRVVEIRRVTGNCRVGRAQVLDLEEARGLRGLMVSTGA